METQPPNYHREFFKSPHHVVFGLLTLGLGFLSATLLGLLAGVTAYALGWIYLPDMPFFRGWVNRREDAKRRAEEAGKVARFVQRREALRLSLSGPRRERYSRLVEVCRDIERASADSPLATPDQSPPPPGPRGRRTPQCQVLPWGENRRCIRCRDKFRYGLFGVQNP